MHLVKGKLDLDVLCLSINIWKMGNFNLEEIISRTIGLIKKT